MVALRALERGDLDRCTGLFVRVFSQPPWNDRWPSFEAARQYLEDYMGTPGFQGIVALDGEQPVAFLFGHRRRWWQGLEFYIDEFGVDPRRQGKGIGTMVIDYLKRELLQEGIGAITLLTDKDAPATAFYAKHGFVAHTRTVFMSLRLEGESN